MVLSKQQIEDALSRARIIRPPREIFVLDGVISGDDGIAIGAAPLKESQDFVILTPLSDVETLLHEGLHRRRPMLPEPLIEVGGRFMGRMAKIRRRVSLLPAMRTVSYRVVSDSNPAELLRDRLKLRPQDMTHIPNIVHYILEE